MIHKQFRIGVWNLLEELPGANWTPQGERSVSEDSTRSIRCKCNISQRKPTPTNLKNLVGFHWIAIFLVLADHWHWQSTTPWRRRSISSMSSWREPACSLWRARPRIRLGTQDICAKPNRTTISRFLLCLTGRILSYVVPIGISSATKNLIGKVKFSFFVHILGNTPNSGCNRHHHYDGWKFFRQSGIPKPIDTPLWLPLLQSWGLGAGFVQSIYPSPNLRWIPKMMVFKMYLLSNMGILIGYL